MRFCNGPHAWLSWGAEAATLSITVSQVFKVCPLPCTQVPNDRETCTAAAMQVRQGSKGDGRKEKGKKDWEEEGIKREEWQEKDSKRDRSGHSKTGGEGRPEGSEAGREMGREEERCFSFRGRNWMSSFTISWRLVNWAGKLRMSSNWGLAKSLRKCKSFC